MGPFTPSQLAIAPLHAQRDARAGTALTARKPVLVLLLTLLALVAPVLPASGEPTTDPGAAAAGWLARQLVDGDHFEAVFGDVAYPDQGLTIDAALGFAAAGSSGDAAAAAAAWLSDPSNASGYVGDGVAESYAGATAKLALLAQVVGADPTNFAGLDLITRLLALQEANGHFMDASAWGDYSNTIGQSLAIIVLVRQPGQSPSAAALDFLESSQCPDGGFGLALAPAPGDCSSGVDTTAFAVQALLAGGRAGTAASGLDYLTAAQGSDGGFSTNGGGDSNANSTGLAAQALVVGGRATEAAAARTFLLTLQQGCDAQESVRGAIAFDASGIDDANAVRATAQALIGLGATGFVELSTDGALAGDGALDCRQATTTTAALTSTTAPADTTESTTTVLPASTATPLTATPRYTG